MKQRKKLLSIHPCSLTSKRYFFISMPFKLEDLPYQRQAIDTVVRMFDGRQWNCFGLETHGDLQMEF